MTASDTPYLTYKLDLIKTIASKAADAHYRKAFDLRIRELRVLRLVHRFPGITATELGSKLVVDKTLLSKNIAYLEARGLISREADAKDNRLQCLSLTEAGLKIWQESERIGRRLEGEMFSGLTPDEWDKLHSLLDRVVMSFNRWNAKGQVAPRGGRI